MPAFDLIDVRPRWQLLDAATARTFPYGAVGALRERRSMELAGTAWLVGAHTAVTAGHAVFDELELQLPGETEAIVVADRAIHPEFAGSGRDRLDLHDVAVLRLARPASANPLSLGSPGAPSPTVEVPGYPDSLQGKTLVTHQASANLPGDGLLLHRADVQPGHSGAPVLLPGPAGAIQAVGIHVGGFNLNPHGATIRRHNTALLITGTLASFIDRQLRAWN